MIAVNVKGSRLLSIIVKSDFPYFSPDAHLDVKLADVPPTQVDRTAAHDGIASNPESVLERRTKILKIQKDKSNYYFVYKQIVNCQLFDERQTS